MTSDINAARVIGLVNFGSFSICMLLGLQERCGTSYWLSTMFQTGSSYLPIVDRIDLVLMYIQSVDDSAHAFVYFIG